MLFSVGVVGIFAQIQANIFLIAGQDISLLRGWGDSSGTPQGIVFMGRDGNTTLYERTGLIKYRVTGKQLVAFIPANIFNNYEQGLFYAEDYISRRLNDGRETRISAQGNVRGFGQHIGGAIWILYGDNIYSHNIYYNGQEFVFVFQDY